MVIEVVVGLRWWCDCGHTVPVSRGGAQLIREHRMVCSWANRKSADSWWVTGMTVRYGDSRRLVRVW